MSDRPNQRVAGSPDERIAQIKTIFQAENIPKIRQHVKELTEGTEFRGSNRCAQFLRHIIERAIEGDLDSLKERVIGVELFGRSPSFKSDDDAVVRVTAREVRRRLLQHYSKYGDSSEYRVNLPVGSYIPEITREIRVEEGGNGSTHHSKQVLADYEAGQSQLSQNQHANDLDRTLTANPVIRRWRLFWIVLSTASILIVGVIFFWSRFVRNDTSATSVLPWSVLFRPHRTTQLILSDPDIASIEQITGTQISVADYASHTYIPSTVRLTPEQERICRINLQGFQTSSVDASISMRVAELAMAGPDGINERRSRSFQLSDLNGDDNFIFLGSPRSDPWVAIFTDQLSLRFEHDKGSDKDVIENLHQGWHEKQWYTQTDQGQAIRESYAIVALVQNPGHNGQVLLLAGENGPGTQAAGELVTNLPRLAAALQQCGIDPHGPIRHFELLLKLRAVADTLSSFEVEACHILNDPASHLP